MKNLKFLSGSLAAVMLATSAMVPSVAQAEVSASLAISNFYLWRGYDLSNDGEGNSAPAISGDISISADWGGYAGVWASSGDESLGQEYDVFAGWGSEYGDFSVDVSYWSYAYPSSDIDVGDVEDLVVGLGYAGVGFTVYESISSDDNDYRYITLDYSFGDFNVLFGQHSSDGSEDAEHIQFSYAYNDNLSFTLSKGLDDHDSDVIDEDILFNIGYSFSF